MCWKNFGRGAAYFIMDNLDAAFELDGEFAFDDAPPEYSDVINPEITSVLRTIFDHRAVMLTRQPAIMCVDQPSELMTGAGASTGPS